MGQPNEDIKHIIDNLQELSTDTAVPKNIKLKLCDIITILSKDDDNLSIRVNKALNILDEISDDNNIQPFSRTQVWNIVSMLEAIQN